MIKEINEYLRDVMKKILDSYSIVENLSNSSIDLELLQLELKKINGLLLVLNKKLTQLKDPSDNFENLNKKRGYLLSVSPLKNYENNVIPEVELSQ